MGIVGDSHQWFQYFATLKLVSSRRIFINHSNFSFAAFYQLRLPSSCSWKTQYISATLLPFKCFGEDFFLIWQNLKPALCSGILRNVVLTFSAPIVQGKHRRENAINLPTDNVAQLFLKQWTYGQADENVRKFYFTRLDIYIDFLWGIMLILHIK